MPETIDWKSIEDVIVRLATANIAEFAAAHPDETFYGFAFDCNADYGQVMPCLNTPDYHELAIDNQHLSPEILAGYAEVFGERDRDEEPRDERAKKIKWSLGDWKYQDFSNQAYEDGWESFQESLSDATCPDDEEFDDEEALDKHVEAVKDDFLRTVCRALVRMENSGAFDCLNRTDEFRACVIDHDELEEDGWQRLREVRDEA